MDTLRTVFTAVMRCARTLGGPRGLYASKASAMNTINASTPQIAALFLMRVLAPLRHRMVVTCFSRCQSKLEGLVSLLGDWVVGSRSL